MSEDDDGVEASNLETFQECLSGVVIQRLARPATTGKQAGPRRSRASKGRKTAIKPVAREPEAQDQAGGDAEELSDFTEYLAGEIFPSLPTDLRTLTFSAIQASTQLGEKYTDPLPASLLDDLLAPLPATITDSLVSYGLISSPSELASFLTRPLNAYVAAASAAPPSAFDPAARGRASECELCARDWLPLTYHHLVPKAVHEKVRKRGWHEEWRLTSVAWLCRACHSFVHGIAGNEELAREWYTVDLLLEREDVQRWVKWAARVRWKTR